ncbi:MAG: mechanosensitive ion channel [Rubrivivax sp.]|nr:mechanosensitive ion channel [Rubrivivax sp.]
MREAAAEAASRLGRLARLLAGLAAVVCGAVAAQGLPGLPSVSPAPAALAASAAAQPSLADWTARLEKARGEHERLAALPPDSEPLLAQRQTASARLQILLAARVDTLDASRPGVVAPAAEAPLLPVLAGEPPYALLDAEALRDHLDTLVRRRATLRQGLKSLDAAVESALRARSDAEANLRLRREQAANAAVIGQQEVARAPLELAEMVAQVNELEVIQSDEQRRNTREQLAALSEPIAKAQAELERVRPHLRFDEADLAKVLAQIEARRLAIAAQRTRLEERLARAESTAPQADALRQRVVPPLSQAIRRLRELEQIEQGQAVLWRSRLEALGGNTLAQRRRSAYDRLDTAEQELQDQRNQLLEDERLVRDTLRAQQARLSELPRFEPARVGEQQVMDALQAQSDAQDLLREGIERTFVLLTRVRGEIAGPGRPTSSSEWLERGWAGLVDTAKAVWQYEVFSATETTQIDGRSVTVEHGVTIGKSVGALLLLGLGYWASGWISRLLVRGIGHSVKLTPQLARVTQRWISSVLVLMVVLTVLKLARIPLTAFAFLGGALAIGFGFGAQNVIKNLMSGVIILFERKIRVGDIITVGGMSGTVTTVDLRATTVHGFDGIDAIVPNSALLENQISNWSGGSPEVRRAIAVGVAYGSDVSQAAQAILRCAQGNPEVLAQPPADVLFEDFGADSLLLRLRYWTRLDRPRGGPGIDSDLRFAIHDALKEAGIAIAFPQRDVHLDVPGSLRVELAAGPLPAAAGE